jgi:hypothetical protein
LLVGGSGRRRKQNHRLCLFASARLLLRRLLGVHDNV